MKYLKKYETLHKKNIIVDDIYAIDSIQILTPSINGQNIPLGRIVSASIFDTDIQDVFHRWAFEDEIYLAKQEEIDAIKYNL